MVAAKKIIRILGVSLVTSSFCLGFNSHEIRSSRASLTTVSYNEESPFDDIRVTPNDSLPGDLPNNVAQDTVDETLVKEKTLYEILGASPTATRAELKRCYVKLARTTHPDAIRGLDIADKTTTDDFNDIAAAWRVLGDAKLRKRYDFDLKAKAFSEKAQRFADDGLEKAAPVVSAMVDNVAATTVAVGDVMGKGISGLVGLSKMASAVAKRVDAERAAKAAAMEKAKAAREAAAQKRAALASQERAAVVAARQRTSEAIAAKLVAQANARAEEQARIQTERQAKRQSEDRARIQQAQQLAQQKAKVEEDLQTIEQAMANVKKQIRDAEEKETRTKMELESFLQTSTTESSSEGSTSMDKFAKKKFEASKSGRRRRRKRQRKNRRKNSPLRSEEFLITLLFQN